MLVDSLRKALEAARRPRTRSQIVHSAVIVKKGVEITEIRVSGARYLTRLIYSSCVAIKSSRQCAQIVHDAVLVKKSVIGTGKVRRAVSEKICNTNHLDAFSSHSVDAVAAAEGSPGQYAQVVHHAVAV